MADTAVKCSMCEANEMVGYPLANGPSLRLFGCPNCDFSDRGITNAHGKVYEGIGPTQGRA